MKIELGKKYRGQVNGLEFEVIDTKTERDKVYGDTLMWRIGYEKDRIYQTEWHTNTFMEHLMIEEVK
jgi:hypothetical protein